MGSFVEVTLAFTFVPDTPPEVLSAFGPVAAESEDGAPPLPDFDTLLPPDDEDLADDYLANWFEPEPPPVADLPLLQQAALWRHLSWFDGNAYFAATPAAVLTWAYERWSLTLRALPKESGENVQAIIAPLGLWAAEGLHDGGSDDDERGGRRFVGCLLDEYTPDPVLIWSAGRQPFEFTGQFRG